MYVDRIKLAADRVVSKDQRAERWTRRGEGLKCLLGLPVVECAVGILLVGAGENAFEVIRYGLLNLELEA